MNEPNCVIHSTLSQGCLGVFSRLFLYYLLSYCWIFPFVAEYFPGTSYIVSCVWSCFCGGMSSMCMIVFDCFFLFPSFFPSFLIDLSLPSWLFMSLLTVLSMMLVECQKK